MIRLVDSFSGIRLVLTVALLCGMASVGESHPFLRDIARPGNEAYQAEDFPRAAQEYLKAQDLEPLSAELRYNLGSAYCRQNEFDKAVEEFTEAARADDPKTAASAYYNLGNSKYQAAKRTFEAGMVAGATQAQSQEGDPVQVYVKKLEECIGNYQETLKRTPDDTDAKFNIEAIRREIKNLMRRQQQNQQQNQDQKNQDQKDKQQKQDQQNKDQQQQQDQKQDQQKQDQQKQDQQKQDQQSEQGTPTPQPMAQMPTPSPTGGEGESKPQDQQQPTAQPTQMLSISEEMARNLLDNLPEQRQRIRSKQRQKSEKDW